MSVVSIKSKTVEAVSEVPIAVPDMPELLRVFSDGCGVLISRTHTAGQAQDLAELRAMFPDATVTVNRQFKTVTLACAVEGVALRFIFELREVGEMTETTVMEYTVPGAVTE